MTVSALVLTLLLGQTGEISINQHWIKGLTYDAKKNVYSFDWQTDKAWKGTCRTLVVKLADGTVHTAEFQFKK